MANVNNNNVSVNFGFAGHVQTGTAVVVRSRQGQMRSHSGKPLSQPHFLRYSKLSSIEGLERTVAAEACWPATAATPTRAWAEQPAANVFPAIWASLVISRASSL